VVILLGVGRTAASVSDDIEQARRRVERRLQLRREAAEHARATIAPEWRRHYAAQFTAGELEAREIVATYMPPRT
jgi:hypothetical protein